MNIRSLATICGRAVWLVSLAMAAKRAWHFFRPVELTRSQEKQRRKQLIAETKRDREKSRHVAA